MKSQIPLNLAAKIMLGAIAASTAALVTVAIVNPPMLSYVTDRFNDIVTPKPYGGNLTPARDITGTWASALNGKGYQLYGQFVTGQASTKAYEDGNIELIIDKVEGNIASGKMRYTNMCAWAQTTAPVIGTISVPKKCVADTGFGPVTIRVSSSSLDFGTISTGGVTSTMVGNFTTDIMSGTMTITTEQGVIKGEFHLMRKQ